STRGVNPFSKSLIAFEMLMRLYAQPKPPRTTVFVLPNGDHAKPPRGASSSHLGSFTPGVPTPDAPSGTIPFSGSPEPGTMVHCRIVACWPVYFTLGFAGSITADGLFGS